MIGVQMPYESNLQHVAEFLHKEIGGQMLKLAKLFWLVRFGWLAGPGLSCAVVGTALFPQRLGYTVGTKRSLLLY